jgi:hypothetical protein
VRKFTLIALTNPVEGREGEFNDWYDQRHLRDVLQIPGFVSARRFHMVGPPVRAERLYRYCSMYEIVTDDPDAVVRELLARLSTASMPISEALAPDIYSVLYEAR